MNAICISGVCKGLLLLMMFLGCSKSLLAQDPTEAGPAAVAPVADSSANSASSQDPAALANRIADLEAYVNNTAPKTLVNVPRPGHNSFMMVWAALALFMTLPGLALFYGGLVRTKNVLSVMAQCLGTAGLVTILWWAFGYSLVFDAGSSILGHLNFAFLSGVNSAPNTNYAAWVS